MLSENLKNIRKAKGLSQEELAIKLNVVRQTVSKWEKGLSVPDSEMLIRLAEILDTRVTVLLGETLPSPENEETDLQVLARKLEVLNEQFARQNEKRRKIWRAVFILIGIAASLILLDELIELIFTQTAVHSAGETVGIIGGADGPTQIIVARAVNPLRDWLIGVLAAIAAGMGIYATRKR